MNTKVSSTSKSKKSSMASHKQEFKQTNNFCANDYKVAHTPGLWTHTMLLKQFTLTVDDFGVKYNNKDHAYHLIHTLCSHYELKKMIWTAHSTVAALSSDGTTTNDMPTFPCLAMSMLLLMCKRTTLENMSNQVCKCKSHFRRLQKSLAMFVKKVTLSHPHSQISSVPSQNHSFFHKATTTINQIHIHVCIMM